MSKDLKDILDDAKDGRLKKSSVKKLEDLAADKLVAEQEPVEARVSAKEWECCGEKFDSLEDIMKKFDYTKEEVNSKINRGIIN